MKDESGCWRKGGGRERKMGEEEKGLGVKDGRERKERWERVNA